MACSTRTALWYVTFVGFGVNYMHRIHINIILVGMIKSPTQNTEKIAASSENITNKNIAYESLDHPDNGFDWDEKKQNLLLGSFFWLHLITQIPGGMLARNYGTKKIFGFANLISCLLTFALPASAFVSFELLVIMRVLQGFILGVSWPSMHHLTAHWIPPNERSKFVSSYLGSSVGVAFTYVLCGFIMDKFGWDKAFYVTGVIGVIWFGFWWYIVFDSPASHPRITNNEREYIQNQLAQCISKEEIPIPWKEMLLSGPMWVAIIAQWGGVWGFYTVMTQTPTFFRYILGWDIKMTGVFTGLPHLIRWLFSFIFGIFADLLLRKELLNRTNVRKLATFICVFVQGLMVLGLGFCGQSSTAALFFLIAAVGSNGAVSSGPLACIVDLSPNFASVTLGIMNVVVNSSGFLSPIIVGYLTYHNQTNEQWQKVFIFTSCLMMTASLMYVILGTSTVQPWNNKKTAYVVEYKRNNQPNKENEENMKSLMLSEEKV